MSLPRSFGLRRDADRFDVGARVLWADSTWQMKRGLEAEGLGIILRGDPMVHDRGILKSEVKQVKQANTIEIIEISRLF